MRGLSYDPWDPPDHLETQLALGLLAKRGGLDRGILFSLLGRPHRYGDLKVLLRGKRDHNLTVALGRLEDAGLVDRRVDARKKPVVSTYEITGLGIRVVLAMNSLQPLQDVLATLRSIASRKASA